MTKRSAFDEYMFGGALRKLQKKALLTPLLT